MLSDWASKTAEQDFKIVQQPPFKKFNLSTFFANESLDKSGHGNNTETCLKMKPKSDVSNVKEDKSVDAKFSIVVKKADGNEAYASLFSLFSADIATNLHFLSVLSL